MFTPLPRTPATRSRNEAPAPSAGLEGTSQPAPLKANLQTWERRFSGSAAGVDFHLRMQRAATGHLHARYQVTPGKGEGWHLEGQLREDNTFVLKGTDNGALFEGQLDAGGSGIVARFSNGDFTLERLVLSRTRPTLTIVPPKADVHTGPETSGATGAGNGPASSGDQVVPWQQTLTPEVRAKLPALKEEGFLQALTELCGRLGIPVDLLLAVMTFESADAGNGTRGLDPKADNGLGYYGLIQFGPEAAHDQGLASARAFTGLSATRQLPYVEQYLKTHGVPKAVERAKKEGRPLTLEELYMSVLGGNASAAYKPVWKTKASSPAGYANNAGLDSNADNQITPTEAADAVRLHWREVYGNNIDDRSRHLEREWYLATNPKTGKRERHWRANYHTEVFSPVLNTPLEPAGNTTAPPASQTPDTQTPNNQTPGGQAHEGHIANISVQERQRIRRQQDWGASIGSLDGVHAYYNDGQKDEAEAKESDRHYSDDGTYEYGLKWQCVEYVRRYLYDKLGIEFVPRSGNAEAYFDKGTKDGQVNSERKLRQFTNGSETKPEYQDLFVFGPNPYSAVGHVAIVSSVSEDSVTLAQQNVGTAFTQSLPLEKKVKNGKTVYKIGKDADYLNTYGWLRK